MKRQRTRGSLGQQRSSNVCRDAIAGSVISRNCVMYLSRSLSWEDGLQMTKCKQQERETFLTHLLPSFLLSLSLPAFLFLFLTLCLSVYLYVCFSFTLSPPSVSLSFCFSYSFLPSPVPSFSPNLSLCI